VRFGALRSKVPVHFMTRPIMPTSSVSLQADPATRELLAKIDAAGLPAMHTLTPEQARLGMLAGVGNDIDPPSITRIEERTIPGPAGELAIRCYYPQQAPGSNGLPTLLYFHGGGFVIGDLDSHDILCRQLCELADVLVVSVEYRLAPEHHYPAAAQDALCSIDWIKDHFEQIGADPARIAVGGDSAGGTLAAVAAQHAREIGFKLKAQLLLYPVVDLVGDYPSYAEHENTYPLFKPVLAWFWSHYFGPNDNAKMRGHIWASPIRTESFADLAPAFVLTAGMDPLRDEGAAYATRLGEAGVETVYHCVMGTLHGFLRLGRVIPSARDTLVAAAHFLRQRL
jgi:acetyl esterase